MTKEADFTEEYDFSDPLSSEVSVDFETKQKSTASKSKAKAKVAEPKPEAQAKATKKKVAKKKKVTKTKSNTQEKDTTETAKENIQPEEPEVKVAVIEPEEQNKEETKAPEPNAQSSVEPEAHKEPEETPFTEEPKKSSFPMMITVLAIVGVILLILNFNTLFGQSGEGNISNLVTGQATTVVATVNGVSITEEFIDAQFRSLSPYNQALVTREMILNKTINEELLLQKAKENNIAVSDAKVREHVDEILAESGISKADFESQLADAGLTEDDIYEIYKRQLTITELLDTEVLVDLEASEGEIERYYQTHESEFTAQEGEIRARHILLASEGDAREVLELVAESEFAELAKEHSIGPTGPSGGDLGFFGRGVMVAPFEEAAFELDVGDVSDIVETQFGFHIIKREANTIPMSEAREQIQQAILREKERAALTVYMDSLRKSARIAILVENGETELEAPVEEPVVEEPVAEEPEVEEEFPSVPSEPEHEEPIGEEVSEPIEEVEEPAAPTPSTACYKDFGLSANTVIAYYASWCTSCQSALDHAATLPSVYFAEAESPSGEVVHDCFEPSAAFPQFFCAGSGEVLKGNVKNSDIDAFAAQCS